MPKKKKAGGKKKKGGGKKAAIVTTFVYQPPGVRASHLSAVCYLSLRFQLLKHARQKRIACSTRIIIINMLMPVN